MTHYFSLYLLTYCSPPDGMPSLAYKLANFVVSFQFSVAQRARVAPVRDVIATRFAVAQIVVGVIGIYLPRSEKYIIIGIIAAGIATA